METALPAYFSTGDGPAVVAIHCSLSSKSQWRTLGSSLHGYRLLAPDLYGYGDTPMPQRREEFTLLDEVDLLQALLDRVLGPDQSFHLLGHSYGGAVALALSHRSPARIKTLTLFEPVAFHLLDPADPALDQVQEMMRRLHELVSAGLQKEAAETFIDYWGGPGSFASYPPRVQKDFAMRTEKLNLDFQALARTRITLDDYRRLDLPVTLMAGNSSRLPALRVAEVLAPALPHCRLLRLDTGHMGPLTDPALVNPLIIAALGTPTS